MRLDEFMFVRTLKRTPDGDFPMMRLHYRDLMVDCNSTYSDAISVLDDMEMLVQKMRRQLQVLGRVE